MINERVNVCSCQVINGKRACKNIDLVIQVNVTGIIGTIVIDVCIKEGSQSLLMSNDRNLLCFVLI